MAITITINGVNQTAKCQDALLQGGRRLQYNRVAGSPATLSLYTYDRTGGGGGYRPAIDQTVVVNDGGTDVFSGVISDIREQALSEAGDGFDKGILCAVTCADQNGLLLRDTYTKTYADGTTVKQILQDLIANPLSTRGITLDGTQANGPGVNGFAFVDAYIDDILNSLTTITGWVWDITPAKVISMISPGSVSCGFSLTDGGGNIFGGVTVEQGRSDNYANRVTVVAGPDEQLIKTDTFTGTGAVSSWVLTYQPVTDVNGYLVSRGYVIEGSSILTLSPPAGGGSYTWTAATNTLTRAGGALGLGVVISITYGVQFPINVTANDAGEQAAHGIYAKKYIAEDVTDKATATQLATGLLSRNIASPQIVSVTHRKGLSKPGRSVVITFSERNLNSTYMITEASFWNDVDGSLTHALRAVSGTTQPDSWVEFFKRGGSANSGGGSTSPISGALIGNVSGMFQSDVVANSGQDSTGTNTFESALTVLVNSSGRGPAVRLGRYDRPYAWVITADADHGATPGSVGKLRFHPARRGSSIECAMSLAEPDTGGTDDFILLPGSNANLYLGDYAALMSGLSAGDSRIEGILAANMMATSGYFERSRTTRMGAWTDVAFNAANFTGNGSMTWTLQAGDQATYSWTMVGDTMILAIKLGTTTVGGTPSTALRVVIPGGVLAARDVNGAAAAINNSSVVASPIWSVTTGQPYVEFFLDISGGTNWAAATNTTYVQAVATFPAQ
jgi:hypothetical protein